MPAPAPDPKTPRPAPSVNPKPVSPAPLPDEQPQQLPGEAVIHQIGFWQEPWVQNVLPLLTSVAIHLTLILAGYAMYKGATELTRIVREQIIIPDSTIVENGEAGGIPNPGLGGDPTRAAAQDEFKEADSKSEGWANKPSDSLTANLMGGGAGDTSSDGMIALGAASGFGKGGGTGTGAGSAVGSGTGDGSGQLARFGAPGGGGGIGPKSSFMGSGGNAMTICYVCDASGSMMSKMGSLKVELKRAIDRLKPIQSFSVVFFQDGKPMVYSQQLVLAGPDAKRKCFDWIENITTAGQTEPIAGMEVAFGMKPQLIYLLTDGDFPDNSAAIAAVRKFNAAKASRVNTIAFVGKGDNDVNFIDVLKNIASENGGMFKKVSEDELN